jgi:hypothetical protein
LNPTKLIFGVTKGNLLSHVVFYLGISIDPKRVIVIQNLEAPTSKKAVKNQISI